MLAIVLGYTQPGNSAAPTVLYAGRDAGEADGFSLAPPAGIVRTELIKHPVVARTRKFPLLEEVPAVETAAEVDPPAVVIEPEPAEETSVPDSPPLPLVEDTPEDPRPRGKK